ncbi:MAG TPA: ABC transporter permease, partial [Gemmatimonadales bacterium]|nr:ABC transporter permease [Gemmatimonadales bacterium]
MTLDQRLVAGLIRLFPGRFRARFGEEMLAVYRDRRDALGGSRGALVRHALATLGDLLVSLPPVYLAERRARGRPGHRHRESHPMQSLVLDLRHTVRALRQQPGFAIVAILTLALGIGANTSVFSVLDRVILAPLPYDDPAQLVRLYSAQREDPGARQYLTAPDFLDVRDGTDAFAALGTLYTYRESGADLTPADGPPRRIRLLQVSAGYFPTLRATPLLGRTFAPDEERAGVTRVVLSYGLWRNLTGGDPAVVGRTISLDGQAYEVIGVMRPGFQDVAGEDVAAWVPANLARGGDNTRQNSYLSAIGRLRPGVSLAQAQAEVDAVMARLAREFPGPNEDRTMRVVPLLDDTVGDSRGAVYVLMGAASLVLLIACLNVANLFLARSLGQARVLAIR